MAANHISRRAFVGVVGSGVMVAPLVSGLAQAAPEERRPLAPTPMDLLAPLRAGSRLARWTVVDIGPLDRGAITVRVRVTEPRGASGADDGHEFYLEVLRRDRSALAPRPPATTAFFAVHVDNGGDGFLPTAEEQGLAAMALGAILARNESEAASRGFLTHAERVAEPAFSRTR